MGESFIGHVSGDIKVYHMSNTNSLDGCNTNSVLNWHHINQRTVQLSKLCISLRVSIDCEAYVRKEHMPWKMTCFRLCDTKMMSIKSILQLLPMRSQLLTSATALLFLKIKLWDFKVNFMFVMSEDNTDFQVSRALY